MSILLMSFRNPRSGMIYERNKDDGIQLESLLTSFFDDSFWQSGHLI